MVTIPSFVYNSSDTPSFSAVASGDVIVGGDGGFVATFTGSIDTESGASTITVEHDGGWTPFSGTLGDYFRTPKFSVSWACNVDGVYSEVRGTAVFTQPIELAFGFALSGTPPDEQLGPSIYIAQTQTTNTSDTVTQWGFSAGLRLGDSDGDPPYLLISGDLNLKATSTISLSMSSEWQPLPSAIPSLIIPQLDGEITFDEHGKITAWGTTQLGSISFGGYVVLNDWAIDLSVVAEPEGSGYDMNYTVRAAGAVLVQLGDTLEFTVEGTLDTTTGAASLELHHEGNTWCPFKGLDGLDTFCAPALHGSFTSGGDVYLDVSGTAYLQSQVYIIPGILVVTSSSEDADHAGPSFGASMTQASKTADQVLTAWFRGAVCLSLDEKEGGHCLDVDVLATSGGDGGASPSSPSSSSSSIFESISITGTYTGDEIYPLAGVLPSSIKDLVVIHPPLVLSVTVYPTRTTRKMWFSFVGGLGFNLPIFGLSLDLVLGAEGYLPDGIGALPDGIFSARLASEINLPGALPLSFDGLTVYFLATKEGSQALDSTTVTLDTGTEYELQPGMNLLWEGASPLPSLCDGTFVVAFAMPSQTEMSFECSCGSFNLRLPPSGDFVIPTINFIRFTAITLKAAILTGSTSFGANLAFELATGDSQCSDPAVEAECITANLDMGLEISAAFWVITMSLQTQGVWVEPLGLRNFAISWPQLTFDIQIPTTVPTVPIPRKIAWAISIYYKPDLTNDPANWPSALTADKGATAPDLSAYVDKGCTSQCVREFSSFFLYEQARELRGTSNAVRHVCILS